MIYADVAAVTSIRFGAVIVFYSQRTPGEFFPGGPQGTQGDSEGVAGISLVAMPCRGAPSAMEASRKPQNEDRMRRDACCDARARSRALRGQEMICVGGAGEGS